MNVKDVIISALNILGRQELAVLFSSGSKLDGEQTETVNTLLYCFNAVEDEAARRYFPLTAKDDRISFSGKFLFSTFSHPPVKIKRVLVDGQESDYELYPQYIEVNAESITVEYEYAPVRKALDGVSDFGSEVGENLLAFGMASEYCLINGESESAELWEKRYRECIDGVQKKLPSGGSIPPRRWV